MDAWGDGFIEVIPPSLLSVARKIGGIVAGAFSERDELIAFVYGFPGMREGNQVHWSHMLAVKTAWRGRGIGLQLKRFQKEFVLKQGIRRICWTYDPLEMINANLNISRLGALPEDYVCDLYGDGASSKLYRLIGTDRFIVSWYLFEADRLAHLDTFCHPEHPEILQHVLTDNLSLRDEVRSEPAVLLGIPENIQRLKVEDPDRAIAWRRATRDAFLYYFGKGYRVTGMHTHSDDQRRSYILSKPLSLIP